MPAKILPSRDGAAPRTPIITRQRLDELECILDRRIARRRQEQPDLAARLRALLDERAR